MFSHGVILADMIMEHLVFSISWGGYQNKS